MSEDNKNQQVPIDLRKAFVALLIDKGIPCVEHELKPYRGTIWRINKKLCYIKVNKDGPWFDVPISIIGQVDVLVFIIRDAKRNVPIPFLISTEDFRIATNVLGQVLPEDGSYNIHICSFKWPNIDMKISLGDFSPSVPAPSVGNTDDLSMTLVFDTFELLESENDHSVITEALRQVEQFLKEGSRTC